MNTLTGEVDDNKKLSVKISSQGHLQASVTPQKSMTGKASATIFTVDDELSHTSTNPVQNKVVTEALDKKMSLFKIAKNTDIDKLFK